MATSEKQQLSRDALLGIFACMSGIGGVVFELGWITRSLLVAFAIGLTIYTAQRHAAHLVLRALASIIIILMFVGFSARPIWDDFHTKHPTVVLPERVRDFFPLFAVAPKEPPAVPKRKIVEATPERAIYKCKKADTTDPKAIDASNTAFKKYIEVYADTNGFAAKASVVPGGIKAELTPATPLGQKNMGNALKMTFEVRKIGRELLGIYSAEFSANVWAGYKLEPDSDFEKRIHKRIEDLVGVEPGDCELQ